MTQAKTRRDRKAEATRRVIMQAGRELFATQPYPDVTGQQICARAGVTYGALQHHFGNKLGLFTAVFDRLQSDVVTRITDALPITTIPGSKRKRRWSRTSMPAPLRNTKPWS